MLRRMKHGFQALVLCLLLGSCSTTVGLGDSATLPDGVVDTCEASCEALDLEFDGVVLEKRSVGCVCE